MQRSIKDQIRRKWIEFEAPVPESDSKPQLAECPTPFRQRPVIVGQSDPVTRIPYPVHKPQSRISEGSFEQVIFDENRPLRSTNRFAKQNDRLSSMVQDINKHHNVKTILAVWDRFAIEPLHVDGGPVA